MIRKLKKIFDNSMAIHTVNAIQCGGDWDKFAGSMKNFDTGKGCISSTAGSLVTNSLTEINMGSATYDAGLHNWIYGNVGGFNSAKIGSISSLNSLAGGLTSSAITYGFKGETTFNVFNLADLQHFTNIPFVSNIPYKEEEIIIETDKEIAGLVICNGFYDSLSFELNYNDAFGLNYNIKDAGTNYQQLAHMRKESVMDYIGLVTGQNSSFDGTHVSGLKQNTIIGQTGNTGLSYGVHLDLTQYNINGEKDNPEKYWSSLFVNGNIKDEAGTRWDNSIKRTEFDENIMNFVYGVNTTRDTYDYGYGINYSDMQNQVFNRLMKKKNDVIPVSYNIDLRNKLEQQWLNKYQNQVMQYRLLQNSIFPLYTKEHQNKLNSLSIYYDFHFGTPSFIK